MNSKRNFAAKARNKKQVDDMKDEIITYLFLVLLPKVFKDYVLNENKNNY